MVSPWKWLFLWLVCASAGAHAGYAQLATPEGFSGGPGDWRFAPSANDQRFGKVAYQPNGLRVPIPGSPTTMPASYRFAANAGRVAAGFVFMNPGIRFAAGVATWLGLAGLIWDEVEKVWKTAQTGAEQSTGFEYQADLGPNTGWHKSASAACTAAAGAIQAYYGTDWQIEVTGATTYGGNTYCKGRQRMTGNPPGQWINNEFEGVTKRPSACPAGWYVTPAGCSQTPPPATVGQPEFEDLLAPKPMPDTVPWELPYPSPLPVEQPVINPEPGPEPAPRPRFVPTGDPVKNPNYNPEAEPSPENQPFIQPGTRVVPSPTANEPWRVDMQPVDRPVAMPDPTEAVDEGPGQTNPGDKPKEDVPGLCDLYPDIVACAKLGSPPSVQPVPNEDKPIQITPTTGWGEGSGTCPAPRSVSVQGFMLEMPFDLLCQFASGIRPVVVALAWLSAVLGFIGLGRKS